MQNHNFQKVYLKVGELNIQVVGMDCAYSYSDEEKGREYIYGKGVAMKTK
jgi:hypothetical protein